MGEPELVCLLACERAGAMPDVRRQHRYGRLRLPGLRCVEQFFYAFEHTCFAVLDAFLESGYYGCDELVWRPSND